MNHEEAFPQYVRLILRTPEFESFYASLPPKVQLKIQYVMNVIACVYNVPTKFIKHLENTDLYEMRVSIGTNEYRTIIFAIDHDNFIEATKVVLLNGFLKKDTKDYRRQIANAEALLKSLEL